VSGALQRAADFGIEHLAITPFGIGVGNLDVEESAEVIADVLRRHRQTAKYPTMITVVVETEFEREVFERLLAGVAA
jgi:O-acetyl-ADP-ribose deacetylase (regulator of RNase III)